MTGRLWECFGCGAKVETFNFTDGRGAPLCDACAEKRKRAEAWARRAESLQLLRSLVEAFELARLAQLHLDIARGTVPITPFGCPECGAKVTEARPRPDLHCVTDCGETLPLPRDLPLPSCNGCGEYFVTGALADEIERRLGAHSTLSLFAQLVDIFAAVLLVSTYGDWRAEEASR